MFCVFGVLSHVLPPAPGPERGTPQRRATRLNSFWACSLCSLGARRGGTTEGAPRLKGVFLLDVGRGPRVDDRTCVTPQRKSKKEKAISDECTVSQPAGGSLSGPLRGRGRRRHGAAETGNVLGVYLFVGPPGARRLGAQKRGAPRLNDFLFLPPRVPGEMFLALAMPCEGRNLKLANRAQDRYGDEASWRRRTTRGCRDGSSRN